MSTDIDFDSVTIEGSRVIFRRKLGQYQLLVCQSGKVYSMTTNWSPALLFSFDTLGEHFGPDARPRLVATNQQEH